jgi:hypothetical protein
VKTAITALAAALAMGTLVTSSIACSSSSSGQDDVDTDSALSALRSPTGSFSEQTAGKAFGGYRSDRSTSSKIAPPGVSSTGTSTQSIRLLDQTSSAACSQNQCACPNGGTMTYQTASSPEGQAVKVSFDACGFEDGWGFDGKAILLASNKSLLGLTAPAPTAPKPPSTSGLEEADGEESAPKAGSTGAVAYLVAAKGTVSYGSKKSPIAFALLRESPYTFLAVAVPDGKIVIGVSDDGRAIVRSKEGTWKCRGTAQAWSCTSDQGKTLELKEEAPSEEVSSNDPPAEL